VHGAQKVLSNNRFRMAKYFCCLTKCHGVPCSLPSRITTKVLKNCKTFSSRPRPSPRPNVQDRQDFMIQDHDQDQDFHFCPRGTSRPRPWSRGLHHWLIEQRSERDGDTEKGCQNRALILYVYKTVEYA